MKNILLTVALALTAGLLSAQTFKLKPDESQMKITGTSTLHDWESDVESILATATIDGETIRTGTFEAEVRSIKSGNSTMDGNTYKAMNADEHPKITFSLKNQKITGGKMPVSGELTIAGVTKRIKMELAAEQWAENQLLLNGSYTLKMSDYGIDPPRAMLGTIRTGDEVTITFTISLQR